jgi:gliding motility-associated-like protein
VYPDRNQPFIAVVQDENGCINRDTVYIRVNYDCSDSLIEVPNIMTPNGDGANDEFKFKNPENIPITVTRVFNRWGEMMFESSSPTATWDGSYQGVPVNPGVYVYVIEGGCPFSRFTRSGNVTVIK